MEDQRTSRTRLPPDVRRAIQASDESVAALARRLGVNPKTVAKWRGRADIDDRPAGPGPARRRALTAEEAEVIVRFRRHTLLPLDDCLYALQARIPHLTRSTLHRCLQRNGMSRLDPAAQFGGGGPAQAAGRLGRFEIEAVEVRSPAGAQYVFKAIEDASKFVFARIYPAAGAADAADFLGLVIGRFPMPVRRVRTAAAARFDAAGPFGLLCRDHGIRHETVEALSPWSDGTAARIGRAIAGVVQFPNVGDLEQFLSGFVGDYNFRRRLKRLGGRTPFEVIHAAWRREPGRFHAEPHHDSMRLEIAPD